MHATAAEAPRSRALPLRSRRQSGVTMVEFALLAPLFLILLFGVVVGGVVVNAQVQLNNTVRDSIRAAAVCGDSATNAGYGSGAVAPSITLPNGGACDDTTVKSYISGVLAKIPGGGKVSSTTYTVYDTSNVSKGSVISLCQKGYKIELSVAYSQPVYLPLVDRFLGDNGTSNRTLKADGQATCEN
jgi:Flp pilus assembly protein TadG